MDTIFLPELKFIKNPSVEKNFKDVSLIFLLSCFGGLSFLGLICLLLGHFAEANAFGFKLVGDGIFVDGKVPTYTYSAGFLAEPNHGLAYLLFLPVTACIGFAALGFANKSLADWIPNKLTLKSDDQTLTPTQAVTQYFGRCRAGIVFASAFVILFISLTQNEYSSIHQWENNKGIHMGWVQVKFFEQFCSTYYSQKTITENQDFRRFIESLRKAEPNNNNRQALEKAKDESDFIRALVTLKLIKLSTYTQSRQSTIDNSPAYAVIFWSFFVSAMLIQALYGSLLIYFIYKLFTYFRFIYKSLPPNNDKFLLKVDYCDSVKGRFGLSAIDPIFRHCLCVLALTLTLAIIGDVSNWSKGMGFEITRGPDGTDIIMIGRFLYIAVALLAIGVFAFLVWLFHKKLAPERAILVAGIEAQLTPLKALDVRSPEAQCKRDEVEKLEKIIKLINEQSFWPDNDWGCKAVFGYILALSIFRVIGGSYPSILADIISTFSVVKSALISWVYTDGVGRLFTDLSP